MASDNAYLSYIFTKKNGHNSVENDRSGKKNTLVLKTAYKKVFLKHQVNTGSVLGPLLFLVYINAMPKCLKSCDPISFADDSTIFNQHHNLGQVFDAIKLDLKLLLEWFTANKLKVNASKTKYVLFSRTKCGISISDRYDLKLGVHTLERKAVVKFLGIFLDENLKWTQHIDYIKSKISRSAYLMRTMRKYLFPSDMKTLYYTMVHPYLTFGIEVWGAASKTKISELERSQKRVIRCIESHSFLAPTSPIFKRLHILKLMDLHELHVLKQMYLYTNHLIPQPIADLFVRNQDLHRYHTRHRANPRHMKYKFASTKNSFMCLGPQLWSKLKEAFTLASSSCAFTSSYKRHMLDMY